MDEKLEKLINAILKTKASNTGITNAKCIAEHYKEIPEIIRTRSIKVLSESLNKKGFVITYNALQLILQREKKKANKLNVSEKITTAQEVKITNSNELTQKIETEENETSQGQQNERPKTIKQIQAEVAAASKNNQSKPQISKSLQKTIDKRNGNGKEDSSN